MTFTEILLDTMKNEPKEENFFDYLFYANQYCKILENIKGESINDFSPERSKHKRKNFKRFTRNRKLS